MSAAFTKGPWWIAVSGAIRADERSSGAYKVVADTPLYDAIPAEERNANANLIAAAPDLYEVATEALAFVEQMEGKLDKHFLVGGKLYAALSKARGESA